MFIATFLASLLTAQFVEVPSPSPCFTDASTGLDVCLQPVEPSPGPDAA